MDLKEKGYNRRERMEWLVIMLVVSLLCMIPCMGKLLPQGDDMTFHILRIESVYHAIKTGQGFPAYIYDKLLEGYGYGAGIFYPDILLLPAILLRFMGIEDENKLKTSRRIASVWVVISMFVAIFIGIIGSAMTKAGALALFENSAQSETLIVRTAVLLSNHGVLSVIMAGLILAGILASTMSTSDSQLLAASSCVSQNLFCDCMGLKLSKKSSMLMARLTVVVIAIIGVFLARNPNSSVFRIVSFAWAGFGATFGAVMLFSLFWKRTNRNGALAGMIVGGVMVFIWKYLIAPLGGLFGIYELLPAFLCSAAAIVVVSLLTAPLSQEIVDEFESV